MTPSSTTALTMSDGPAHRGRSLALADRPPEGDRAAEVGGAEEPVDHAHAAGLELLHGVVTDHRGDERLDDGPGRDADEPGHRGGHRDGGEPRGDARRRAADGGTGRPRTSSGIEKKIVRWAACQVAEW